MATLGLGSRSVERLSTGQVVALVEELDDELDDDELDDDEVDDDELEPPESDFAGAALVASFFPASFFPPLSRESVR